MNNNPRFALHRPGIRSLHALAYLVLLSLPASAAGPLENLLGSPVPDCIGKWCPDDYCAKKEPCVRVPLCFGCDDYRRKKAPCVNAPLCFGCDDYRKKSPPKVCSGPLYQFLKCGSPGQPRGCGNCQRLPCDGHAAKQVEIKERSNADGEDQLVYEPSPAQLQRLPAVIVRVPDFKLTK